MSLFLADCLKISILDYSLNYKEIYRLISESIFKGLLEEKVQAEDVACTTQEKSDLFRRKNRSLGSLGISTSLPSSGANFECTKSHIAFSLIALCGKVRRYFYAAFYKIYVPHIEICLHNLLRMDYTKERLCKNSDGLLSMD